MSDSTSRRKPSGAMASIIERGQENVGRLEATFRAAPVTELPTDYLSESRNNTRRRISEASVRDMVNGIVQAEGEILQPLLVRPIPVSPEGHRYEVICGNRRLNAARRLDLKLVPVRVREMSDETARMSGRACGSTVSSRRTISWNSGEYDAGIGSYEPATIFCATVKGFEPEKAGRPVDIWYSTQPEQRQKKKTENK